MSESLEHKNTDSSTEFKKRLNDAIWKTFLEEPIKKGVWFVILAIPGAIIFLLLNSSWWSALALGFIIASSLIFAVFSILVIRNYIQNGNSETESGIIALNINSPTLIEANEPANRKLEIEVEPKENVQNDFDIKYIGFEEIAVTNDNGRISRLLYRDFNAVDEVIAILGKFQAPTSNSHDMNVKAYLTVKNLDNEEQVFTHRGVWLNDANTETTLEVGGFVELILILSQFGGLKLCEPEYLSSPFFNATRWVRGESILIDVEIIGRCRNEIVFRRKFDAAQINANKNFFRNR